MQRIGRSRGTIHEPLKIVLSWRLSHSETDDISKTVIINSLHIIETDRRKRGGHIAGESLFCYFGNRRSTSSETSARPRETTYIFHPHRVEHYNTIH